MDYKAWRKARDLTQAQAAALIGMSNFTWGQIEANTRDWLPGEQAIVDGLLAAYDAGTWEHINQTGVTGSALKLWRTRRGLTTLQAGEHIGCSGTHWSSMENGKAISDRYQLALALLIGREETPVQQPEKVLTRQVNENSEPTYIKAADWLAESAAAMPATPALPERGEAQSVPAAFDMGRIRRVIEGGLIWFHLADVCRLIDYSNPSMAVAQIEPDDLKKFRAPDARGQQQEAWFMNEAGLNQFLLSSNVPKARPFRKWVTGEVIPTIRQTGSYSMAPGPAPVGLDVETLARLMGLRSEQALTDAKAYADGLLKQQTAELAEVRQAVAAAPTAAADEVLARLQAVDSLKGHLHRLVEAIVTRAKALPQSDPFAWQYSQFNRAWRAVHGYAQPPVMSKAEYRTPEQVAAAIRGAEMILTKLGAEIPAAPEQLVIDLPAVSA